MKNAVLAALAIALSGCAHPLVSVDPISFQSKVEDVADWDAMADRQAERFAVALGRDSYNGAADRAPAGILDGQRIAAAKGGRPFYIVPGTSDFARAFRPFLEKHLIEHGYTVSANPAGAWDIQFDTQTFLYARDGRYKRPVQYATFWTTLGALGLLATDEDWSLSSFSADTGAGLIALAGPIVDGLAAINSQTNAEVLLVVTVSDPPNTQRLQTYYRGTESFYVHPSDLRRYWGNELPSVNLPVRAPRQDLAAR